MAKESDEARMRGLEKAAWQRHEDYLRDYNIKHRGMNTTDALKSAVRECHEEKLKQGVLPR